jgi:hypothetical protein
LWEVANRNPDTPLFDLTGARYEVLSDTIRHAGQAKWLRVERFPGVQIYENINALPRAFIVHDSVVIPDPAAAVEALRKFEVNPGHTVILENGEAVDSDLLGTAEPGASSESEWVRSESYTSDEVRMRVKASAPGWLVMTDNWYPGWESTIDGAPTPIELANTTYRAIPIESGEHQITMRFSPATWRWGRVLSLGTLGFAILALVALFVIARRSSRRT